MGRLSEYVNSGRRSARRTYRRKESFDGVNLSDIKELAKQLNAMPKEFQKTDRKKVLGRAATAIQQGVRSEAPYSLKSHYMKDDGGTTKKVHPGNLRRSIQIFTYRRSWDVFVGPIARKSFKGKNVDGQKKLNRRFRAFYWRMVYYGAYGKAPNRFIDRGAEKSRGKALMLLKASANAAINRYIKKNKLG